PRTGLAWFRAGHARVRDGHRRGDRLDPRRGVHDGGDRRRAHADARDGGESGPGGIFHPIHLHVRRRDRPDYLLLDCEGDSRDLTPALCRFSAGFCAEYRSHNNTSEKLRITCRYCGARRTFGLPSALTAYARSKGWLKNLNTTSMRIPSAKFFATGTKRRHGSIISRRRASWANRCGWCGCGSWAGWM